MPQTLSGCCDFVGEKYGIAVVNKRISLSPIGLVGAPFSAPQMVEIAHELNDIAKTVNIDFMGGFSALVEKGIAPGDRALMDAPSPGVGRNPTPLCFGECGHHTLRH